MYKDKIYFVAIFISLTIIIKVTSACDQKPTAVISGPNPRFTCVGEETLFEGNTSHDNDLDEGADSIVDYEWQTSQGGQIISGQGEPNVICEFPTAGMRSIRLNVKDDEGNWSDWTDPDTDVYVIRVNSLTPNEGTPINDGDGNSDTNTYVVSKAAQGVVEVTAGYYPETGVTEDDLPACWSLTLGGDSLGTVENKTLARVNKNQVGCTTVTCTAGTSSKEVTIYVVEEDVWLPEPDPTYIQIIYDGDNVTDTEVKIFHNSSYSTWEDYGFTTTQLNDEDTIVTFGPPLQTQEETDSYWDNDRKGDLQGTPAQGSQTLTAIWEDDIYPPDSPPVADSTDDDEEKECTVILLPCPTGENTEKCDPDHVGTYAHFKGQLKPTDKDYSGFKVDEFVGGEGEDFCHFVGSLYSKWTEITGSPGWTVGENNYWQPDEIGWSPQQVLYYRMNTDMPCNMYMIQDMKVVDPSNSCGVYQTNTLEAHIGMTTLTSKRGPSENLVIITWTW